MEEASRALRVPRSAERTLLPYSVSFPVKTTRTHAVPVSSRVPAIPPYRPSTGSSTPGGRSQRPLAHRQRLARDRGILRLRVLGAHHEPIRGEVRARLHARQVAYHHLVRGYLLLAPVAQHHDPRGQAALQSLGGGLRPCPDAERRRRTSTSLRP